MVFGDILQCEKKKIDLSVLAGYRNKRQIPIGHTPFRMVREYKGSIFGMERNSRLGDSPEVFDEGRRIEFEMIMSLEFADFPCADIGISRLTWMKLKSLSRRTMQSWVC